MNKDVKKRKRNTCDKAGKKNLKKVKKKQTNKDRKK